MFAVERKPQSLERYGLRSSRRQVKYSQAKGCSELCGDVKFARCFGTFDEVYPVFGVAYGRSETGEPMFTHELCMAFVRENGELKLLQISMLEMVAAGVGRM